MQGSLAEAANLIDSAQLHLERSANVLGAAMAVGGQPRALARARIRMDSGHASHCLREAVQLLLTVSGASTFARTKPTQQYWLDLETAARHPTLNGGLSREIYGRALVGVPEQVSSLL